MTTDTERRADLLVAGGGMIGLTLGVAAAQAGLDTIVVDRLPPEETLAPAFDGRVSSIAWGSHRLFEALGVWDGVADEAEPILDIRVSDQGSPFFLHFDHREAGDHPFGFMVENRFLRAALQQAAARTDRLTVLAPATIGRVERGAAGVVAELTGGGTVRAPLVAAADGRGSRLRREAGIRTLAWRYPQTAIVTTLAHEQPHFGVAKEHFLPAGPFALLPMRDNRSSLVWTERERLAPAMLALDDPAFVREVERRAGDHLGRIELAGPRFSHPLGLENAERYTDRRLALVGDAAHAMHPIAGQGLNLGLRDVACLVEVLLDAARIGLDLGDAQVLRRYQEWRRFDSLAMLVMTDGLNRLFSTRFPPVRIARQLGLGLVQNLPPVRRFFETRASAAAGDLPKLIRGELP